MQPLGWIGPVSLVVSILLLPLIFTTIPGICLEQLTLKKDMLTHHLVVGTAPLRFSLLEKTEVGAPTFSIRRLRVVLVKMLVSSTLTTTNTIWNSFQWWKTSMLVKTSLLSIIPWHR